MLMLAPIVAMDASQEIVVKSGVQFSPTSS
jgi:hypothetical protein